MSMRISRRRAMGFAATLWILSDDAESVPIPRHSMEPSESEQDGRLELDVKSKYSHIRIRRLDNTRGLWFVRDSGEEVLESSLNLDEPHELLVDYTRYMFLSYLFKPQHRKVLIIGLGGGSMVHFLRKYDPEVAVEAVEIDPVVVQIADEYFGVRSEGRVEIVTADGLDYLARTEGEYDVIYMDAFLKPSRDTDRTGVPLRLKTRRFYKEVQTKLTPDGLVVFNLNPHLGVREDVRTIRSAFPQTYVYELPTSSGYVVVGARSEKRLSPTDFTVRAAELDRRFETSFSFREMARHLTR